MNKMGLLTSAQIAWFVAGAVAFVFLLSPQSLAQSFQRKTAPDYAGLYSSVNIFGDSLMDAGNLFHIAGVPPSPPYAQKFSNGPIWVEQLADRLNLSPVLSIAVVPDKPDGTEPLPPEGINFAIAGSLSSELNLEPQLPGLSQQIVTFVKLAQASPTSPNALFLLLAGGNDYNSAVSGSAVSNPLTLDALPEQVTNNLTKAAADLIGAGARHLVVGNLPDLGQDPYAKSLDQANPRSSTILTQLSAKHNQLLAQKLTALSATTGVHITQLNLNALLASVVANPGQFGFKNVIDPCLTHFKSGFVFDGVCNHPDEFLFWDDVHPTQAGHGAIAQLALSTLTAQKSTLQKNTLQKSTKSVLEPIGILGLLAMAGSIVVLKLRQK